MGPRLISRGERADEALAAEHCEASMGPRLISRGERRHRSNLEIGHLWLQWGHG